MSEPVKAIWTPDFPTPAIAQKAEAALVVYKKIKALLALPPNDTDESFWETCARGDITTIADWIKNDASRMTKDYYAAIIYRVVEGGHVESTRLLLEHYPNPLNLPPDARLPDSVLNQAFEVAARCGHFELARMLIEDYGTDVNGNEFGALGSAVVYGRTDIVALMLRHGAKLTVQNHRSILNAAYYGHKDILALAIAQEIEFCKNDMMRTAADQKHPSIVRLLIDHGADEDILLADQKNMLATYDAMTKRWQQVIRLDPIQSIWQEDPSLFKGTCYESVRRMLVEEGCKGKEAATMAFHTAALFQSETRVLQYLRQWGTAGGQPLHDLVQMIQVPSVRIPYSPPDLKDWADGVLKCGPSMAKLVKFADRLSSPLKTEDGRTWSMVKTREECAKFKYARGWEHLALAALCFEHSVTDDTFEQALSLVQEKQPANKNLPYLVFNGESFGMPGGTFRRLSDGDINGLFLGEMTDCCQSIGGAGSACAEHGFTSENGGFYVVENAKGRIVGQSWAWRGKKGELCLDSLETLGSNVTGKQWLSIVEAFHDAISVSNDHNITALTIGTGGATRDSCPGLISAFTNAANAVPKDYDCYRDSHSQVLVWSAKRVMGLS